MKKLSVLLAVIVVSLSVMTVVYAADPSSNLAANDRAERVKLSRDLHDIQKIRDRINATILEAANTIPPEEREDFQKYVQLKVDYSALEAKSIEYAADVYTAPELKAMIAYFGSADGQSAEAKGQVFVDKISKDIITQVDAAILAAKYDGAPDNLLPKTNPQKQ